MKRALVVLGLLATPTFAAWESVCPPGTGVMRDSVTGEGRCMPGGFGDVVSVLPTVLPSMLPGMIPTPVPTRPEPSPQPTFSYTAPTPQPTKALDPTGSTANYDVAATTSHACINGPSTITVAGAVDGDACVVGVPAAAIGTGVTYHCHVSAANTVTLRACKLGTTTFNPPAGTFTVRIIRP